MMDADRMFRDFDIHLAEAVREDRAKVERANDDRLARGIVRPVRRWWQKPDVLFLIGSASFCGGSFALVLLGAAGVV